MIEPAKISLPDGPRFEPVWLEVKIEPVVFVRAVFHSRLRDAVLADLQNDFGLSFHEACAVYDEVAREHLETPRPVHGAYAAAVNFEARQLSK